ncbi:hypothetical protein F7725_002766 [Dissostichus mawsoni]|uniref:Uncharacterized protein n=1 Tax=Dissostichus mawsoni TaxID=36200 RepID=A0A7J5YBH9_DISMA|nr:hypothetical protein F7725_002766 [Dissostichus mawsoni]
MLDSVLGDRPTSGFGSTVNSLSLASIVLQDDSLNSWQYSYRMCIQTKEQGQEMLKEVHAANAELLRVFNRIEQNSHSMLGLYRIVKVMEANNKS